MKISIHAPTRGATNSDCVLSSSLLFQSTLPREERRHIVQCLPYACFYFNPRSHERSDIEYITTSTFHQISIHAPTRGATSWYSLGAFSQRFQSTLPREERPTLTVFFPVPCYFNPRSHERSDHFTSFAMPISSNFNPRSHERSDGHIHTHFIVNSVFQSTLPREERQYPFQLNLMLSIFQSTLPREERLMVAILNQKILVFQSTLPREERLKSLSMMGT